MVVCRSRKKTHSRSATRVIGWQEIYFIEALKNDTEVTWIQNRKLARKLLAYRTGQLHESYLDPIRENYTIFELRLQKPHENWGTVLKISK